MVLYFLNVIVNLIVRVYQISHLSAARNDKGFINSRLTMISPRLSSHRTRRGMKRKHVPCRTRVNMFRINRFAVLVYIVLPYRIGFYDRRY
jgi:hypothetical protein